MALAASVVGSQVPLAAVTLETLGLLLEVLGEVPSETAQLLQAPLMQKLTCQSSLLRKGVGQCHFRMQCQNLTWCISLLLLRQLTDMRLQTTRLLWAFFVHVRAYQAILSKGEARMQYCPD